MPQQVDRATLERIKAARRARLGTARTPARPATPTNDDDGTLATIGGYGGLLLRGAAGFVPGGIPGAIAGGGAEAVAQLLERLTGARDEFSLAQIPTQAGIGAIPFGKFLKGSKLLGSTVKGSAFGAGSSIATDLAETGEIDPQHVKRGMLLGAGGGALSRALVSRFGYPDRHPSMAGEVVFNDQTVQPRAIKPSGARASAPPLPAPARDARATAYPSPDPRTPRRPGITDDPYAGTGDLLDRLRAATRDMPRIGSPEHAEAVMQRVRRERGQVTAPRGADPHTVPGMTLPRTSAQPPDAPTPQRTDAQTPGERFTEGLDDDLPGLGEAGGRTALFAALARASREGTSTGTSASPLARAADEAQLARGGHFEDTAKLDLEGVDPRLIGPNGKLRIPAELVSVYNKLKPRWDADRTAQASAGLGEPTVPSEDLVQLALRHGRRMTERAPRDFMGAERKAHSALYDRLNPKPKTTSESGFITPDAAFALGGAATGAAAAPLLDDDPDAGTVLGGAALGGLTGLAARRPDLLERLRYFSLLSSPTTHAKNVLGNASAVMTRATEDAMTGNPQRAGQIVSEFFKGKTLEDLAHYFKNPSHASNRWGSTSGFLGVPSRLMGAMDDASKAALNRAGLTKDDAELITFTGEPRSKTGSALVKFQENAPLARFVMPFVRTATNIAERGLERTPGVGFLPAVRRMDPSAGVGKSSAKQALGALAMILGSQYGDDHPLMLPAMGPLALPGAVGAAFGKAREGGKSTSDIAKAGFEAAVRSQPLPIDAYKYDPAKLLAQFVPNALRDVSPEPASAFDTGGSLLDPAIAKIPVVNETLPRKRRRASRARTRRRGGDR